MIPSKATAVLMRLKEIDKKYKVKYDEQKQHDRSSENTESLIENTRRVNNNALVSSIPEKREILKPTLNITIPDVCTEQLESRSSTTDRISLKAATVNSPPDDNPSEKSKSISEIEELLDDGESIAEIIDRTNFSDSGKSEKSSDEHASLVITVENSSIKDQRSKTLHHGSNDPNFHDYSNDSFEKYSSDEQSSIKSQNKRSKSRKKDPASAQGAKLLSESNESTNNEIFESRNERETLSSSKTLDSSNGKLNARQRKSISLKSDKKTNGSEELSKSSIPSRTTSAKDDLAPIKSKTSRSDDDHEIEKEISNLINSLHSTGVTKNSIEKKSETSQINDQFTIEKESSTSFKSSHSTSVKEYTKLKNSKITRINDERAIAEKSVNSLKSLRSTGTKEDSIENQEETSSFRDETGNGQELTTPPKSSHSTTEKSVLVKRKSKTWTITNHRQDEDKLLNTTEAKLSFVKSKINANVDREKKISKTHRMPQFSDSDSIEIPLIVAAVDSERNSSFKTFRERRELNSRILTDVKPEVKVSKILHKPIRRARRTLAIETRDVSSSCDKQIISSQKKRSKTCNLRKQSRSKTDAKRSKSSMFYRSTGATEYLEPTDREFERLRTRTNNLTLEHEREFMLCYMKDFEEDRQRLFLWPNRLDCPRNSKIAIIEPLDFPNVTNFTKPDTKGRNSSLPLPDENLEVLKNRVYEIRQWLKDQFILYRDYCEVAAAINAKYMKIAEADKVSRSAVSRFRRETPEVRGYR